MTTAELIAAIAEIDPADAPAVLAAVASLLAQARPVASPLDRQEAPDDQSLTIEEAATLVRRSTKWIYRHRKQLPFVREMAPRSYIVSKNGLERWLAKRPC